MPEQLVLLLELLLEEAELSVSSLRTIKRTYDLQKQDAEVRHRWCELVVKHKYAQAYGDVEHFLIHDQVTLTPMLALSLTQHRLLCKSMLWVCICMLG
uniref:Peptidase M1 leukotriene A4 hydrolase/aminopeptidase C-terminal domain-containing protein n=1 Tax=Hucho hucho TaxID=62062 RepID=A0A4W5QUF8_9TELE